MCVVVLWLSLYAMLYVLYLSYKFVLYVVATYLALLLVFVLYVVTVYSGMEERLSRMPEFKQINQ